MKKKLLILVLLAFSFAAKGYAQECGDGIAELTLYTKNGKKIKEVSYEVFAVSKELKAKYKGLIAWGSGSMLNDFDESNNRVSDSLAAVFKKNLERGRVAQSGKFKSRLQFRTLELLNFPVIVKVTIANKTAYLFGNYFGGCNREIALVWNGNNIRLL